MDELDVLSKKYNRSKPQCKMLFDLLGDINLYIELEEAIEYLNIFYCPGDLEECNYVLSRYRVRKHIDNLYEKFSGEKWDYKRSFSGSTYDFDGNEYKTFGGWKN